MRAACWLVLCLSCAPRGAAPVEAQADGTSDVLAATGERAEDASAGGPASVPARAPAIYFLMVDRFHNGNADNDGTIDLSDPHAFHGGDLAGVRQRLDWIEGMGFTDVWLTPVFAMRTEKLDEWGAYHGYWVNDLASVEPRFGNEAELKALAEALHERQMGLWLDMVWNHVGFDAPLRSERPDWFHPSLPITDWNDTVQVQTHEVHGLPDLAQEKPEVYAHLRDTSIGWLDRTGADGFRIDAVRHMPEEAQARLAADLRSHRPVRLLGEVFDGDPARLQAVWSATTYDHVFDFPLRYAIIDTVCKGAPVGRLASTLSLDRLYDDPTQLVTFLDNHDTSRLAHECGGDVDRVGEALDLLFSLRGTPSVTWGTEIGLDGAEEPENRADMRFVEHPLRQRIERGLARRTRVAALQGRTEILDLRGDLLVWAQVGRAGTALVTLNRGQTTTWRGLEVPTGVAVHEVEVQVPPAQTREVVIQVDGDVVVGAGPALGGWVPERGVPVVDGVARLSVASRSVLAFKAVRRSEEGWAWPDGADNYVFVRPGEQPMQVTVVP